MTKAVDQHQATTENAQEVQKWAAAIFKEKLAEITINPETGHLEGITPALKLSAILANPGRDIVRELASIDVMFMYRQHPITNPGQFVADRLAINARRQARAATRKRPRMAPEHRPTR
jgi:hypothetical protein